jgi:anaerobic magnesium-protoporphyrin IX monomethyl ester cyclase
VRGEPIPRPRLTLIRVNERLGVHPFLRETNVSGVYPALGVAYLAGAARRAGFPASVIDAHAENLSHERLTQAVARIAPDVVGLTSTTFNWPVVAELARRLRAALPGPRIVVGGPQLSLYPEECMAEGAVDVAVIGEGDDTIVELLARLRAGQELAGVAGTLVRADGDVVSGPDRAPIADLDALALPALDLLPLRRYRSLTLPRPFVSMVTSRGCPYRCRYCSQAYVGGAHREHGVGRVLEEVERAVKLFHAREIVFFDETFTLNRGRVLAICAAILDRGLRPRWNVRTRADRLDDELLEAMREAGCASIHVGIEAGSARVRELMNKRLGLERGARALARARRLGMETRGYFMLGYPGETREEVEETIRLATELPLDWASFTVTTDLPGTDLYRAALAGGRYPGDYWREYSLQRCSGPPGYASSELTAAELEALLARAYRRFYLRPTAIAAKLANRRLWRQLPSILGTTVEILARRRPGG